MFRRVTVTDLGLLTVCVKEYIQPNVRNYAKHATRCQWMTSILTYYYSTS